VATAHRRGHRKAGEAVPVFEGNRPLLAAFRRGAPEALHAVFLATHRPVLALLCDGFDFASGGIRIRFRGMEREDERADLLSAVYVRAFAEPARLAYDGLRPYTPFVVALARNVVVGEFRRRTRAFELLPLPEAAEPVGLDAVPTPEELLLSQEAHALVRAYIATLGGRERRVLDLRMVEGLTRLDVQQRTGLTASQVRTSEERILAGLAAHLARAGWEYT